MAHEISINSITGKQEAAYALKPAWHGLGTVLDSVPDSATMLAAAGLDWTVEARPAFFPDKQGTMQPIPDRRAIVRSDTDQVIGCVGADYGIVQNTECFSWMDSLLQDGIMRYESAAALKGGRIVFVLARMPGDIQVGSDDIVRRYLLFQTSHDGSMKLNVGATMDRVECHNMLMRALSKGLDGVSLRHTSGIKIRLDAVKHQISQLDRQFTEFGRDANKLRDTKWTPDQAKQYIAELFPTPDQETGRAVTIWKNRIDDIRDRLRNDRQGLAGRDNFWGLYNAVSEHIDHASVFRGQGRDRDENRFLSVMTGRANDTKRRAFELALQMAS